MVTLFNKVTSFTMVTFAVIVTKVITVHSLLWLGESARSDSLHVHFFNCLFSPVKTLSRFWCELAKLYVVGLFICSLSALKYII